MDWPVLGSLGRQWPKTMAVVEVVTSINVIRVRMSAVQNRSRTRSLSASEALNYSAPNYTQTMGLSLMVEAHNLTSIYLHNKHISTKSKPQITKATPLEVGVVEPTDSGRMTTKTIGVNTCEENKKYFQFNRF